MVPSSGIGQFNGDNFLDIYFKVHFIGFVSHLMLERSDKDENSWDHVVIITDRSLYNVFNI